MNVQRQTQLICTKIETKNASTKKKNKQQQGKIIGIQQMKRINKMDEWDMVGEKGSLLNVKRAKEKENVNLSNCIKIQLNTMNTNHFLWQYKRVIVLLSAFEVEINFR